MSEGESIAQRVRRRMAQRASHRALWRDAGYHDEAGVAQHIADGVMRWPDARLMFVGAAGTLTVTSAELHAEAMNLAAGLQRLGLRRGDVIAVQLPHCAEGVQVFVAAMHLGLVVLPVTMIYRSSELGFILSQSGARALVVPGQWRGTAARERLAELEVPPTLGNIIVVGGGVTPKGMTSFETLVQHTEVADRAVVDVDDVCLLLYTSGTTAAPKGVLHTHATFCADAMVLARERDFGRPAGLAAMPAGHMGGLVAMMRPFFSGSDQVFMEHWDAALAADLIERHQIVSSAVTPIHLQTLMEASTPAQLGSLRRVVMGGANVPPQSIERAESFGISAMRTYGSSEHPTATSSRFEDPLSKRSCTDGRPMGGSTLRLLDAAGHEVSVGEPGEVTTMGPELFVGYLDALLDAEVFTPDGWFRTGDIGVLDADGYMRIVDRKKDIIIRGGENISSKEVEDVLARHPQVIEAAAVGVPDARYGERVVAVLRVSPGAAIDLASVQQLFLEAGVARQKTPERVVAMPEFPRTAAGKIQKRQLRDAVLALIALEGESA